MSSLMTPVEHPVLAALRAIDAGLDELGEANLWSLGDAETLTARAELERLGARLGAQRLRATREVHTRGAAVAAGAASTRAWLINTARAHPGAVTRELGLAAALDQDLPATAAALAAGQLTEPAAAVIAETDTALARFATAAQRAQAEAILAAHAATLPIRGLQNAAAHLSNRLDPDHGQRLGRDEEDQRARREFTLRPNPDGSARPHGYLDKEAAALLRAALDPLAKPRPADAGTPDPRSPAQRRGDALVELIELALRSGNLPTQNGQPVQLVITIELSALHTALAAHLHQHTRPSPAANSNRVSNNGVSNNGVSNTGSGGSNGGGDGNRSGGGGGWHRPDPTSTDAFGFDVAATDLGATSFGFDLGATSTAAGLLDTGLPLSVEAVRRLACDAQIIPMVLGGHGEPLDVGRAARTPPPPLRRALDVRDKGCAFPGCDRPSRWCRAHHIWHWTQGGPTSIGNSVLLCDHHHRVIHHHGWDVHIEPDALPSFYPPPWIDPDRAPRRHHRYPPHPPTRAHPNKPPDGHPNDPPGGHPDGHTGVDNRPTSEPTPAMPLPRPS